MRTYGLALTVLFLIATGAVAQQSSGTSQRIAYLKLAPAPAIWISTLDGKQQKMIADGFALPSWSPDGTRVAYSNSTRNLFLLDLRTGKKTSLVSSKGNDRVATSSWSPDGKQIVYTVWHNGEKKLFEVDVESKQTRQIMLSGGIDCASEAEWAPDGKSLAVHDCSKDHRGLALIEPSGKLIRTVTQPQPGTWDAYPVWVPDGKRISFVSTRGDTRRRLKSEAPRTSIFVVNADGTDLHPLVTHGKLSLSFPSWSSDGKLFACEASEIEPERYGRMSFITRKVLVMSVPDWQEVRTGIGDDTAEPVLAPMPK